MGAGSWGVSTGAELSGELTPIYQQLWERRGWSQRSAGSPGGQRGESTG